MYSAVKRLRASGARLSDHNIAAADAIVGRLILVWSGMYAELSLCEPSGHGRHAPLIPVLYNARVIGMRDDMMLWEGEERGGPDTKAATVKQEWSVKLGVSPLAANRRK